MPHPISRQQLAQATAALGFDTSAPPFSDAAFDRLLAYGHELHRWNLRIRLVGPKDARRIITEQIVDSLGFAHALLHLDDTDYWDIGSGGGLPAIPMAILFPDHTFHLVEPIAKKTAFLKHAAGELNLPNIHVHTGRLNEDGSLSPPYDPGQHPTVAMSRATLNPEPWISHARALVGPNGKILLATAAPYPTDLPTLGDWTWEIPTTRAPRHLTLLGT